MNQYCTNCGKQRENTKYCAHCGHSHKHMKRRINPLFYMVTVLFGLMLLLPNHLLDTVTPKNIEADPQTEQHTQAKNQSLQHSLQDAKEAVFTVTTNDTQGSAFLYDDQGHIVTNAHVVKGESHVGISTNDGQEYNAKVIGYSNEIDVAVLSVEALEGQSPLPIEANDVTELHDKVVAIGSPNGEQGVVSHGKMTNLDVDVMVDDQMYEDIYEMTAAIDSGSSGGPLIDQNTHKVIAINTAKSLDNNGISYSIPMSQVNNYIEQWINQPMSANELQSIYQQTNVEEPAEW
ncbi:MAG TPA: trypsin-like peptidase domain-containing protein [Candidatus Avamphibacillus intestinigallinarum]|nr:trypsin-like peptidase domain-containing protein [Candidatus Avamphibacillus intestinigallinarum]